MRFLQTVVLLTACMLCARAAEKRVPIKLAEAPRAVRKAVTDRAGKGKVGHVYREGEQGGTRYLVEIGTKADAKELELTPAGAITQIRQPATLDRLPKGARDVLTDSVGDGKILLLRSAKLPNGVIVAYEADYERSGKAFHLRIGPKGNPVPE